MANDALTTLVGIAMQRLPETIAALKGAFMRANPTAPEPTDEEVKAAEAQAIKSSLAKDDQWLAAHPPQP